LVTDSYALRQLRQLRVDAVNLAHNHIQDKGLSGISETVNHLEKAAIGHFGAGSNNIEAREPFWLTDDIALLGYCEFDKPYLKQIVVATESSAGVAPLRLEIIKKDLELLPQGKRAILYFHWGREHVWLPPYEDIVLAKRLLEDDRVLMIIGMHPHRPQGVVEHNGKKAYMCIGNFLFPNFYISPPTRLAYPEQREEHVKWKTRRYHGVYEMTYKKWKFVNRVSLIVQFDTETYDNDYSIALQKDNEPVVVEPKILFQRMIKGGIKMISLMYCLPHPIYQMLEKSNEKTFYFYWRIANKFFLIRQKMSIFFSRVKKYA